MVYKIWLNFDQKCINDMVAPFIKALILLLFSVKKVFYSLFHNFGIYHEAVCFYLINIMKVFEIIRAFNVVIVKE